MSFYLWQALKPIGAIILAYVISVVAMWDKPIAVVRNLFFAQFFFRRLFLQIPLKG